MKTLTALSVAFAAACLATSARADGARDWENVPINTNILFVYYTYSNNEIATDPSLPIEGVSINAHVPIVRYARTFALGDRVAGIQLVAPYGFIDAKARGTRLSTDTSGLGDIQAIFLANLFGAPALTRREFASWEPDAFLTASVGVTAPTGSYDENALLNVGKNRWIIKPQLAYGRYFGDGALLSVNANLQFFSDNDAGGGRLEQDPMLGLEAHLSQDVGSRAWMALDAIYAHGGETQRDGTDQGNAQRTLRLGVSGSYSLNTATAVSASVTRTVVKESYTPAATTFSININRAF